MLGVVGLAALSFVALRQRGVLGVGDGGSNLTGVGAPAWSAVAGALLVIAAVPRIAALLVNATRRGTGGVAFLVAARVRESGARALPILVITVTVAQLAFALAMTSTEQRGQAAGPRLSVGGDARATVSPGVSATELAHGGVGSGRPGSRRRSVNNGVRATARDTADQVQLVVVSASAYQRLLARSALPDAPSSTGCPTGTATHRPCCSAGRPACGTVSRSGRPTDPPCR